MTSAKEEIKQEDNEKHWDKGYNLRQGGEGWAP